MCVCWVCLARRYDVKEEQGKGALYRLREGELVCVIDFDVDDDERWVLCT